MRSSAADNNFVGTNVHVLSPNLLLLAPSSQQMVNPPFVNSLHTSMASSSSSNESTHCLAALGDGLIHVYEHSSDDFKLSQILIAHTGSVACAYVLSAELMFSMGFVLGYSVPTASFSSSNQSVHGLTALLTHVYEHSTDDFNLIEILVAHTGSVACAYVFHAELMLSLGFFCVIRCL